MGLQRSDGAIPESSLVFGGGGGGLIGGRELEGQGGGGGRARREGKKQWSLSWPAGFLSGD
jgi:hypothetical protein